MKTSNKIKTFLIIFFIIIFAVITARHFVGLHFDPYCYLAYYDFDFG